MDEATKLWRVDCSYYSRNISVNPLVAKNERKFRVVASLTKFPVFSAYVQNIVAYVQNIVACVQNIVAYVQNIVACVQNIVACMQNIVACVQNIVACVQNIVVCVQNIVAYVQNVVACVQNILLMAFIKLSLTGHNFIKRLESVKMVFLIFKFNNNIKICMGFSLKVILS